MERAFGKIKLEEEVQGNKGSSFVPISTAAQWNSPVAVTKQSIYQEAEASFQQFLESYRWRLAGHPVPIKIEEADPNQVAPEAVGESQEETAKRERLERAERRGRKKAKTSNRHLPLKTNISQRNLDLLREVRQQEELARIAERAANSSVRVDISAAYHPTEPVPVQVIPGPPGLAPQHKTEDCDFDC